MPRLYRQKNKQTDRPRIFYPRRPTVTITMIDKTFVMTITNALQARRRQCTLQCNARRSSKLKTKFEPQVIWSKAGVVCLQVKLCDPHLSDVAVRFSRRGAIQIYVYVYLYYVSSGTLNSTNSTQPLPLKLTVGIIISSMHL